MTRMRKIYITCITIFIVCLLFVIYLLFFEGGKQVLPFIFTSDASKNQQYSISYETGSVSTEEENESNFHINDMQNLSFSNSIDTSICNYEECPSPNVPENITIDFTNAVFKIYDVTKGEFSISDEYQNGEIRFRIYNTKNDQYTSEFTSISSLEDYLHIFLIANETLPTSLRLSTLEDSNRNYHINLYSNYMGFYQKGLYSKCKVILNFTHRSASPYFVARHTTSVHESCPQGRSTDLLKLNLTFAVNKPVIIETNNVGYALPSNGVSDSGDRKKYLIVLDSADRTTVTAFNNMIDFYTIGYVESLTSNGALSLPKASIMTDNLMGSLIYGRNEFLVPPYSKLYIRDITSLMSNINYAIYVPDNQQNAYTIQARGNSEDISINNESLISDKNEDSDNFRSLAIPVLTAILTGILSFFLGLFVRNQDN
ncbi:MAG: hypothetical protein ISR58_13225 [Anaerolineales bacterium]|nr:hypothetical protein [Chloroflexota bacterium]MBL6982138.1 hypothetical protein [Anaerolineales bacterium]